MPAAAAATTTTTTEIFSLIIDLLSHSILYNKIYYRR